MGGAGWMDGKAARIADVGHMVEQLQRIDEPPPGFAPTGQFEPDHAAEPTLDDQTDQIIPTMMKSLVQGANFNATVSKANTELQNVLNTGKSS